MKAGLCSPLVALALAFPANSRAEDTWGTPPPPARSEERLLLDGYFRTRGRLYYNLDLNRGPTPTTGEPIFPLAPDGSETLSAADMRTRLDVRMILAPEVRVHLRVDALDDVMLGSTPQGLPADSAAPSAYASTTQVPPVAGINALTDSFAVKRAWGEARTPFGTLVVGRMGMPTWGAGIVADPGDDLDADHDQDVDRVGFASTLADHVVGVSWDWNAIGPWADTVGLGGEGVDLYGGDDVHTLSFTVARLLDAHAVRRRKEAGGAAFTWGAWLSRRRQEEEVPAWYRSGVGGATGSLDAEDLVRRDFALLGADLFVRVEASRFDLLGEFVLLDGRVGNLSLIDGIVVDEVTMRQAGAAFEARVGLLPEDRLVLGLGARWASGDDAPGFGVAPGLDQVSSQPGDLDGPQFSLPSDTSVDNFRFNPNHRVDLILWRRLVGTVTDALVLRPSLSLSPHPRLDAELALVYSRANELASTPASSRELGTELDVQARWRVWQGLEARGAWGVFFPGAGLNHEALGLKAEAAQLGELMLAFVF
jgi:uncharacterized protein (TIGR04551 family)